MRKLERDNLNKVPGAGSIHALKKFEVVGLTGCLIRASGDQTTRDEEYLDFLGYKHMINCFPQRHISLGFGVCAPALTGIGAREQLDG